MQGVGELEFCHITVGWCIAYHIVDVGSSKRNAVVWLVLQDQVVLDEVDMSLGAAACYQLG